MVAATGAPFSTSDYFADDRLTHDPAVDASVRTERQVSIVGVPLMRHGVVIGVLFAANREVGRFSHDAIALLGSFAALAALAIDAWPRCRPSMAPSVTPEPFSACGLRLV